MRTVRGTVETGLRPSRGLFAQGFAKGVDFPLWQRHAFVMNVQSFGSAATRPFDQVSFDRFELGEILSVYGRFVAAGLWRDYAISCLRDKAVFSVFHRTAENPLYRIEKAPALRLKQGQFALVGSEGQIVKRGGTLRGVLAPLERKLLRVLD
jgi:hypothetical protein